MKAEDIITPVKKQLHPYLGPQKISDAALLSTLGTMDEIIVQETSQVDPDGLTKVVDEVDVTTAQNRSGYRLKESTHYEDFKFVDDDDKVMPINMVRRQDLEKATTNPAGALVSDKTFDAGRFFPADPLGKRWAGSDTRSWYNPSQNHRISYSYVPLPETPSKLSDHISSPRAAIGVLTNYVVMQALMMQTGVPQARLETAIQSFQTARQTYLMQMYKRVQTDPPSKRHISHLRSEFDGLP